MDQADCTSAGHAHARCDIGRKYQKFPNRINEAPFSRWASFHYRDALWLPGQSRDIWR
jgi:hypothetical protein